MKYPALPRLLLWREKSSVWNFDVYLIHIGGPRRHIFGCSFNRIIDYCRLPQAPDSTWKLVNALRTVTAKLPADCDATLLAASALQNSTDCACWSSFTGNVPAQTFKFFSGDTSILEEYRRRKFHSQNPGMINEVKWTNSIKTGSIKLKSICLTFCTTKDRGGGTKFPIVWCDFVMSEVDDESV